MTQTKESKIKLSDQLNKFDIKAMIGFHAVIMYGLGREVGIFKYLYNKAQSFSSSEKITSVSFTIEELSDNLNLGLKYLDAWLHMGIECGLFEIESKSERIARTAPHVYDLFVNPDSIFYLGGTTFGFYESLNFLDTIRKNFKTGKHEDGLVKTIYKEAQEMSAVLGKMVEYLFSKYYKEDVEKLQNGGIILEIGCGYGLNLQNWIKKYKKAKFVGIDLESKGIEHAKKLVEENDWRDRVEFSKITLEKYVKSTITRFDLVILNQVLHEMNPSKEYRISVLENIYTLLKEKGILLVGEHIIPDTFSNENNLLYEVMHKWFEVTSNSVHYDEVSFKNLVKSTSFSEPVLIRERRKYCWVLRK